MDDESTPAPLQTAAWIHTDLVGLDLQVPCRLFNKGQFAWRFKETQGRSPAHSAAPRSRELQPPRTSRASIQSRGRSGPGESIQAEKRSFPWGSRPPLRQSFVERFGSATGWGRASRSMDADAATPAARTAIDKQAALAGQPWRPRRWALSTRLSRAPCPGLPRFRSLHAMVADAGGLPTHRPGPDGRRNALDEKLGKPAG